MVGKLYTGNIGYRSIDIRNGPRVHFISCKTGYDDFLSIYVTVGFGSSHVKCRDHNGKEFALPRGMAHFMEHFLFWNSFEDRLCPMVHKYLVDPNAFVTYDRTSWYLRNAYIGPDEIVLSPLSVDEDMKISAACDIVKNLMLVNMCRNLESGNIDNLIRKTVNDVKNEISHRHSNLGYRLQMQLMQTAYARNPVRYDILGSPEDLDQIDCEKHVRIACDLVSRNIESVTVLGHNLSDKFIINVEKTVCEFVKEATKVRKLEPLTAEVMEDIKVFNNTKGVDHDNIYGKAPVLMGFKLSPLEQAYQGSKFLRIYLVTLLITKYFSKPVNCVLSRSCRIYLVGGVAEDYFFLDIGSISEVKEDLRKQFISRLVDFKDCFQQMKVTALTKILDSPRLLAQICDEADLYRFRLEDVLEAFNFVTERDLETLIHEIKEARHNMAIVYAGNVNLI